MGFFFEEMVIYCLENSLENRIWKLKVDLMVNLLTLQPP